MLRLDPEAPGSVWIGDMLVRGQMVERTITCARPVWREILDAVSKEHNISVRDIVGDGRFHQIVIARQDAMWRMRRSGMTYAGIGRRLGGRDHATIMWGVVRHEQRTAWAAEARQK